jgi:uncharacterized membrane protein (UPF0127 family)
MLSLISLAHQFTKAFGIDYMKKILLTALILFVFLPVAVVGEELSIENKKGEYVVITTQEDKEHRFLLEIAMTPEEQQYGLMFRTEMPEDRGMFFISDDEAERNFWMKNTFISLDLIFINSEGVISHIHRNAVPLDLTPISSEGPAKAVIELNGGIAEKLNIQVGDVVHHYIFANELAE